MRLAAALLALALLADVLLALALLADAEAAELLDPLEQPASNALVPARAAKDAPAAMKERLETLDSCNDMMEPLPYHARHPRRATNIRDYNTKTVS